MRANPTLISALRRAADRIAAPGSDYDWESVPRCNCGILAQELLGVDEDGLHPLLYNSLQKGGLWCTRADDALRCERTGLPLPELFALLRDGGVELSDIERIEYAGSDRNEAECLFNKPQHVAAWFRKQADLLEAQLTKPTIPAPAITINPGWPTVALARPHPETITV